MSVNIFNMKQLEEDVKKYHTFLLEHVVDVFSQNISFDFLKTMILFSGIVGDDNYLRGVCHLLSHKVRRSADVIIKDED